MVSLLSLYQHAANSGVSVDDFPLNSREALTVVDDSGCFHIALDRRKVQDSIDEKVKLAHELGHCETGAFYARYMPYETVERCEQRAERRAIERRVSKDDLDTAVQSGVVNPWDLAELFEVPQPFMEKAIAYYHMLDQVGAYNGRSYGLC